MPAPAPLASLGLARWYVAGSEGAREARGVGRVAGRPEVPEGGAGLSPRDFQPYRGAERRVCIVERFQFRS
jgi:hypothetical protein